MLYLVYSVKLPSMFTITIRLENMHASLEFSPLQPQTSYILLQIYLNEALHYKNGYTVAIQPEGVAVWTSPRTNHIEVTHNEGLPERTVIQVTITPK